MKAAWHGGIDFIDPALAYYQESWQVEYVTCVKLLNYPDKPAPAGYRSQPEAARRCRQITQTGLNVHVHGAGRASTSSTPASR